MLTSISNAYWTDDLSESCSVSYNHILFDLSLVVNLGCLLVGPEPWQGGGGVYVCVF